MHKTRSLNQSNKDAETGVAVQPDNQKIHEKRMKIKKHMGRGPSLRLPRFMKSLSKFNTYIEIYGKEMKRMKISISAITF